MFHAAYVPYCTFSSIMHSEGGFKRLKSKASLRFYDAGGGAAPLSHARRNQINRLLPFIAVKLAFNIRNQFFQPGRQKFIFMVDDLKASLKRKVVDCDLVHFLMVPQQ